MKILAELSKENLNLSIYEFTMLLKVDKYDMLENFIYADISKNKLKLLPRLAYTNGAYKVLFITENVKNTTDKLNNFNFAKEYKDDFCIRTRMHMKKDRKNYQILAETLDERKIAPYIYKSIEKNSKTKTSPKVDLKNPKTLFILFCFDKSIICTKSIYIQEDSFEERKNNFLPESSPISMHPKLARAMINLSGAEKGKIIDPMCGTGAILIESLFTGMKAEGNDIDKAMINRSRINLDHIKKKYSIKKAITLKEKDFFTNKSRNNDKIDYIITDLPFGKNTKDIEKDFYDRFFDKLSVILKKKAIIGMPIFKEDNKIVKSYNIESKIKAKRLKLRLLAKFDIYIHKSLSKRILVLEKKH